MVITVVQQNISFSEVVILVTVNTWIGTCLLVQMRLDRFLMKFIGWAWRLVRFLRVVFLIR